MSLQVRACAACYGLVTLFTALSARLIFIGVVRHDYYTDLARANHVRREELIAVRGSILDAKGAYLARNEPLRNVILDGSLIRDRAACAGLLARLLGMKEEDVLKQIDPARRYVVLKKKISEELAGNIAKAVDAAHMKGVSFEQDFRRIYPAHDMLCHIVGFFGFEETDPKTGAGAFHGIEGIERSMDNWLAGEKGWRYVEKDGRGRVLANHPGDERAPKNGADVRLTVDLNLQQIVESELADACKRLRPIKASAVMMNPETGEIMALANRPSFDPNEPGKAKPEERFNNAIAGILEPGSTFKAITCAGAIDSRLVTPNTQVFCEHMYWKAYKLHDHHAYDYLSVAQIIEHSSNIGAAKLAVQLGEERFYNYIRAFGFGQHTGIQLPGEVRGILHPRTQWSNLSISRIAMGHEVGATPLQVTAATCAIANGGRLMIPRIIRDIRWEDGSVAAEYQPQEVRRVVSTETAGKIRDALIKVTGKSGTASKARIPGFDVAGKTGTAQKIEDGHYSHDRHVTSFIGFVPAEKPAFCLAVIFDEAQVKATEDVGGLVAAPVFKAIAEKSLAYLGVRPNPVLLQREKEQELILAKAVRN